MVSIVLPYVWMGKGWLVVATYPPVSCEICHKRVGMVVDSILGRSLASE